MPPGHLGILEQLFEADFGRLPYSEYGKCSVAWFLPEPTQALHPVLVYCRISLPGPSPGTPRPPSVTDQPLSVTLQPPWAIAQLLSINARIWLTLRSSTFWFFLEARRGKARTGVRVYADVGPFLMAGNGTKRGSVHGLRACKTGCSATW